ncbi:MAG TPA: hypothetical protein VNI57_13025 [Candidatus Saccharimonadales bacterium]|nr:hypothetical protein [Candidatus Saccharimonadales bacterium]
MLLLAGISCAHATMPVADERMPAFEHRASDPHCLGRIISGPTVLQGPIWFVQVQLEDDPNIILPAITSPDAGIDVFAPVAVWFIRIGKMKYFPIGDTFDIDPGHFYNPIVLAEKPHPEWTEKPSHPVYCPKKKP